MDYVHNSELIRGALDLLNLYDGLQFILPEEERADGILKLGQITRHKKFLYKTFTSRKNSKGIICMENRLMQPEKLNLKVSCNLNAQQ